jgi:hypothetical protein
MKLMRINAMNYKNIILAMAFLPIGFTSICSQDKESLRAKISEIEKQIEQVEAIDAKLSKCIENEIDKERFEYRVVIMTAIQINHSIKLAHLKYSLSQLKEELKEK